MNTRTRTALADGARTAGLGLAGYLGVALTIVAIAGLCAFGWWISVLVSGPKGAGDVTKDQNSAQNREYWSAKFNGDMQQLQADQANLATLKQTAAGPGATQQDAANYQGALLNCRTDAATYNTDANNVLAAQWIPAGLPTSVNATTYCGS